MAWLEDVAGLISTAGVATLNTNMFLSTAASIPSGVGPYLLIVETAGAPFERIQNSNQPAYEWPGAQITVRAFNYILARNMATLACDAVDGIYNVTINGVWYREISALQRPFDIGTDDSKRVRLAFNILGVKALS
jgi:hypothetical protein